MFITLEQIASSLKALQRLHPFFGTSFLAFKEAQLPVGDVREVIFTEIADRILQRHYKVSSSYSGYYSPFQTSDKSKRWVSPRYGSTSLQRITTDTFADALLHTKKTSSWGWRSEYLTALEKHLGEARIPTFHLAVWLFRDSNWEPDTTSKAICDHLLEVYGITSEEQSRLFDSDSPIFSSRWLTESPVTERQLVDMIGPPPGATPDEGAALRFLELHEIGPAGFFRYEPAERLNIITGDNSLGKTFILECIWWALTGDWIDYPALPRDSVAKRKPQLVYSVNTLGGRSQDHSVEYDWSLQQWKNPRGRHAVAGLVIYARFDGSFAVWDPARSFPNEGRDPKPSFKLFFQRGNIWDGLKAPASGQKEQWICNGLIRDWVSWQTSGERYRGNYEAFLAALKTLSPSGSEKLAPGEPMRVSGDAREIPTLRLPYGDVPIIHASAGVQRIVALAYLMVWTWHEHLANSAVIRREPQKRLVFLIDEAEAHLHPFWQRVIVPAIMKVLEQLSSSVKPQIHLATHSPLVLASAEAIFDDSVDDLHHLRLGPDRTVILEELAFVRRGTADVWLISEAFGLTQARSIPSEEAIEDAKSLQLSGTPTDLSVKEVHARLVRYLAPDDEFWPRWLYFAKQHGVER